MKRRWASTHDKRPSTVQLPRCPQAFQAFSTILLPGASRLPSALRALACTLTPCGPTTLVFNSGGRIHRFWIAPGSGFVGPARPVSTRRPTTVSWWKSRQTGGWYSPRHSSAVWAAVLYAGTCQRYPLKPRDHRRACGGSIQCPFTMHLAQIVGAVSIPPHQQIGNV